MRLEETAGDLECSSDHHGGFACKVRPWVVDDHGSTDVL
jgi:hypothetical protein